LAGVAVIMIVSQLGKLTGAPVEGNSVPAQIASFLTGLGRVHAPTVALSALLLVVLLVGGWLRPHWPMPLIGMLAATGAVAVFSLQQHGIEVLGQAAIGIPTPGVPPLSVADLGALALPSLGVAVVAYSDNVLTARAFGVRRSQAVDANAELVALGMANLAVGFLRGFPVSSSGSRTAIGDAQGSRSQLPRWSRSCWWSLCWRSVVGCWLASRSLRWAPWWFMPRSD
jgi:MFS superfamily sulfate permease-like transporter